eukprot:963532-Pleurochrysis_carterae.AAC.1
MEGGDTPTQKVELGVGEGHGLVGDARVHEDHRQDGAVQHPLDLVHVNTRVAIVLDAHDGDTSRRACGETPDGEADEMREERVQQPHQLVFAVAASPREYQHLFVARRALAEDGRAERIQHGLAHDGVGKDL